MMERRQFITLIGGAAAAWPLAASAQQPSQHARIGQVRSGTAELNVRSAKAFEQRLNELGQVHGINVELLNRFVPPQPQAMEDAIRELLPNIDLLIVWGTMGGVAARKLVPSLPVVFVAVAAPVEMGLVESLARPGSNLTGITFEAATETYAKRLEILKEIVPSLTRAVALGAEGDANFLFAMASLRRHASMLEVTLLPVAIASIDDLSSAFDAMKRQNADGLISVAGNLTSVAGNRIADLALAYRLPSCYAFRETVEAGGLVSLGPDRVWMAKQAAEYVDKIIRGARPDALPVQQPDRYELHINLKTAKALGLEVPPTLLARADEVIE
jgi:putative ABC transport system substrate-binding protein